MNTFFNNSGAAIAARGVRSSIDVITDNAVKDYFSTEFPLNSNYTSEFVDFVALGLPILTSMDSFLQLEFIHFYYKCLNVGIVCCALREIYLLKVANTMFAFIIFLFMIISGITVGKFCTLQFISSG